VALQLAACSEVEALIGAAQLHIRLQRHRVVALHEGVEQLVQADGLLCLEALVEFVTLQHLRNSEVRGEADGLLIAQLAQPLGVVAHLGLLRVEDFEDLLLVGLGELVNLLAGESLAGHIFTRWVADQ